LPQIDPSLTIVDRAREVSALAELLLSAGFLLYQHINLYSLIWSW